MAIAAEALTPEVAGEYQSLVSGGMQAGKPALDQARANVSKAGGRTAPPAAPSSGQRHPVRYAVEKNTGALWVGRHAKDVGRIAPKLLPSSVSGRSSILPRLITAGFLGLLVLEAVSYLTGHYFNYDLKTPLRPAGDQTYRPLYQGQVVGQSNPHVNPAAPIDVTPQPLSNRSAGNLSL